MAHFRPVHLPASVGVRPAGWVVEKYENGARIGVVSRLYSNRSEAKAEADKLNALDEKNHEGAQSRVVAFWLREGTMQPFELRFFENDGTPSLILHQFLSSKSAAIRSGTKMAGGRAFEIWRGKKLIYGIDDVKPFRNSKGRLPSLKMPSR